MASLFKWLTQDASHSATPDPEKHSIVVNEQEDQDQDQGQDPEERDIAPAFPAINSAQRSRAATPLDTNQSKPPPIQQQPPSIPVFDMDVSPPSPTSSTTSSRTASPIRSRSSQPPPTSSYTIPTLATPTTTTKKPNPKLKKKQKVALAQGCSPLDWARLKSGQGGVDMKGGYGYMFPMRVTLDELKKHSTEEDAWSAFNGRVYNITPYIRFHPGGEKELMRCAGRDGTKLFMATHAWVNVEFMMDACLIGMLVSG